MPEDIINVRANSFWEFRKLLKLAYQCGYTFFSNSKPNAFNLWFGIDWFKCDGLSFYSNNKMKFIEKKCDIDTIDFKEYLLIIHGII